jgi:hypothetical protein
MAEIKCPSCGKINPETLELCQYCGTGLQLAPTEPLDPLTPGELPVKKDTAELERTLPGWLRDARRAADENTPAPADSTPVDSAPEPPSANIAAAPLDLLAGLSQTNADEEEAAPEWLLSLRGNTPELSPAAEPPAATSSATDWLEELQGPPAPAESTPQPEDWGFSSQATYNFDDDLEPPLPPAGEVPDWLATLQAQETTASLTPASASEAFPTPPGGDFGSAPDWLSELGGGFESNEAAPAENLPGPTTPIQIPAADLPDWMQGLAAPGGADRAAPETENPASEAALPDWIADLSTPAPGGVDRAAPETENPASEAALPDWIADLSTPAPGGVDRAAPETENPASEAALPDWIADLSTPAPGGADRAAPETELSTAGSLPDWLAGLSETGSEVPAPGDASSTEFKPFATGSLGEIEALSTAESIPDFMSGLLTDETKSDLPDWMKSASPESEMFSFGAQQPAPAESEKPVETDPAALADSGLEKGAVPFSAPIEEDEDADPFLAMEIPEWLSGLKPVEAAEDSAAAPGPDAANLPPADLPSWVQAMRPVESMLSGGQNADGEESEAREEQGPLAGFYSVLPIPASLQDIRKPKMYAIKLQANENQRTQADLLEKLIRAEGQPKNAGQLKESVVLRPLRWVIFAMLSLAVLLPAVLGSSWWPAPVLPAAAEDPFNRFAATISGLPEGAVLLVVTDYQPGFAGEMEQVAGPVMVHLMHKNSRLAFLSTSTVSTELGERLVEQANAFFVQNQGGAPIYEKEKQFLFLGYLPGGAAGVQAFAERPQQTTGRDSLNGNLWQSALLGNGGIEKISGFDAVLVLTDDPDNGRMWIEQTAAALAGKPLLMVASAQAAPMLQPYSASGQLSGLVSGLDGGVLYETRNAAEQLAPLYAGRAKALYWDGYGAAVLIAGLSIVIGGAWSVVSKLRARRSNAKQDEA